MATRWCILAGAATVLAMAAAADSGLPAMPAGKPGLYELRASTNGSVFRGHGAAELPQEELQRLADEALEQFIPVIQFCASESGAMLFDPTSLLGPACKYSNVVRQRNGYTADARCAVDDRTDVLHLTVEAGTPEHQKVTMSTPLPGTPFSLITRYEIAWLSSDCGGLPPGAKRTPQGKLITSP